MRASDDKSDDDDSFEGLKEGPCHFDLNGVSVMLGDDCTQFKRVVEQEDIHHPLNDEDITVAEANAPITTQ